MNLSSLTPDAKFEVAKKLPTHDLLAWCSTDTNMRQICLSHRFSPIWSQKLKEDYNIDYRGSNGYIEYLLTTYNLKQEYYVAIFLATDNLEVDDVILCRSREEGYAKITERLNDIAIENKALSQEDDVEPFIGWPYNNVPYLHVKMALDRTGSFEIGPFRVSLEKAQFNAAPVKNYQEIYQEKLRGVSERIFPHNLERRNDFIRSFEDLISDEIDNPPVFGGSIIEKLVTDGFISPDVAHGLNEDESFMMMLDDLISGD